ncbi:signal peptidase II [Patescibacteria group bacterium]|nr:signal peptidase II [Patescibacteria group bacterium]
MKARLALIALFCAISVVIVDQLSKFIVISKIPQNGIFIFHQNFLTFKLNTSFNADIAFSLHIPAILLASLLLAILVLLLWLIVNSNKINDLFSTVLFSLIFGGAISNIIDRFLHGAVIDFISISIYNFNWALFNPADFFITAAAIILIIKLALTRKTI